jgi:RimJ/RimL family protein N-acetyltransferase
MWREPDVDALHAIYADPDVGASLTPMRHREDVASQIEGFTRTWAERGFGQWAAEEKATGRFAGRIGLLLHGDWSLGPGEAEMGWVLARAFWGRGFATEGLGATLGFAFDTRGLERVVTLVPRVNKAAARLLEKLGLTRKGAAAFRATEVVWYAIERDEWERPSES